ncbi:MAG: SpoIIIAH-like family protein [Ruminococcaceae bacterium]|nr:SpoIIIAH-like family protein [Oscillospiraceae bacterium]
MQLLGKQYFEQEEMMSDVPASVSEEASDGMTDDEALETLCEAVSGRPRLPAWMSAAAGMVRDNRRHLVVAASVLVIGFAIYLNWTMAGGNADAVVGTDDISPLTDIVNAASVGEEGALAEDLSVSDLSEDDYFAVSQINRQRARDEAIAVLQDVVDGAANLSDVQSDALAQISQIAADIEKEAAIESLVRGKGFADCVAVISGENVNVIVRTAALLPNEVAQIQEIVYETAGILPANVKIIEK